MTQLLVSVRNVEEAILALDAGVDLIDVKEPLRGALGAADGETIAAIVRIVADQKPTSAALGELNEGCEFSTSKLAGLSFAKFGLADCGTSRRWIDELAEAIRRLPQGVAAAAVIYADWRSARAPSPASVLDAAAMLGCRALLIDTLDKAGGTLFDRVEPDELASWLHAARAQGLLSVLAGGLSLGGVKRARSLGADYLGVRGAACAGGRSGRIDRARLAELVAAVRFGDKPGNRRDRGYQKNA